MFKKIPFVSLFFNLAITTLNFVFGLYFLKLTGSAFIFGTLVIIGPIVSLLLTPFMSMIVDTFDRKKVLISSQLISLFSLIIYELIGSHSGLASAYVLMIAIRIAEELFIVTLKASVPQLVVENDYQKINALVQSGTSLANVLSPIVGGMLYAFIDLRTLIYLIISLIILSTFISFSLNFNHNNHLEDNEPHKFKDVLTFILDRKVILNLVVIAMFVNFFSSSITIGLPIIILDELHLSELVYSLLESVMSATMVINGLILSIKPINNELSVIYKSMFSFAIILLFFGIPLLISEQTTFSIYLLTILVVAFGFILICANTVMTTFIQKVTPNDMQGGIYSIISALSQFFVPLGTLCYGILFDCFSSTYIFIISGSISLLIISILLHNNRYSRIIK
ncbi:MFS transporter [Streptococcus sp. H49]|uniref:MFS transporter n=1 Tax=Streptococcus huangxiaojuni TaxID=3237239 RepID=UPI0034A37CB3